VTAQALDRDAGAAHQARPVSPHPIGGSSVRLVVVVGNPKPASRTYTVAAAAARAVALATGSHGEPEMIDLSGLAPRLLIAAPSAAVEDALDQVSKADLLLVASPTFKGTYTGLLKVFLDLLPHRGLESVTALPLLVMRAPQHALAVEVHLRPLLVELGASVPAPGLAVLESDLGRLGEIVVPWAASVANALAGPRLAGAT
jgi:FMN reductase